MKAKQSAVAPFACTCLVASLALAHGHALAQEQTQARDVRLSEVTWSRSGTYHWQRPDNVRYILVRACGGGGGGGGGFSIFPRPVPRQDAGTAAGGGGGAGAIVSTILLGPLTAPAYTVVIGSGGKGAPSNYRKSGSDSGIAGHAGTASSFTGLDLSFETPGAAGGQAGVYSSRMSEDATSYRYIVTKAASSSPTYAGGGSYQNGARGLLGLGGAGNASGDSGGGGGSIGSGGAGGAVNSSGADGGTCAGGGGAGYLQNEKQGSVGGSGGDGSLTLLSLATGTNSR
jgi:hypothetical protein